MRYLLYLFILPAFIYVEEKTADNSPVFEFSFSSDKIFHAGEELVYLVSYSFINLGEVKLRIRDKKTVNGKTVYNTIAYIDSYSSVPFVDLHQIYESSVSSEHYPIFFRGIVKEKKYSAYTEYRFNYEKSEIHVKKGKVNPPEVWTDSTTTLETIYQDGLSIFYYARAFSGSGKSVEVPCFVTEKKEIAKINFYNKATAVTISAVDYPINCVRLDGSTDFVSVFGLTGYFEGWFTNDEASIPVVAKMKVIIGNITLELIKWKREGWAPPKYKQ